MGEIHLGLLLNKVPGPSFGSHPKLTQEHATMIFLYEKNANFYTF
jgi:hypothetical protein